MTVLCAMAGVAMARARVVGSIFMTRAWRGAMIGETGARYGHWRTSPNPLDVAPDVALWPSRCEISQDDMA
jgi:hypothetical protein